MKTIAKYPDWICADCGNEYGRGECKIATWHNDICGICFKEKACTQPRDFGHLGRNKIIIGEDL